MTSGRFTTQATEFASRAGIALIHLDELVGDARALNRAGRQVLDGPRPEGAHQPES